MTCKAVIFDLDGVIVDTVPLYYKATLPVINELGVPFTEADNLAYQGRPRMELIDMIVKRSGKVFTEEEKIELGEWKNRNYQELIAQLTEEDAMPGIYRFIQELSQAGIPMALASASSNAQFVLKQLGLTTFFDVIMDPKSLKKGKPDPEIFETAADRLGVPYENCVAIEDGEAGLEAIRSTPMFSIGVGTAPYLDQADWTIPTTASLTLENVNSQFNRRESKK
ncbi:MULTISPECIES: beta-phosphoglucomutase [Pontibacillus]|uniref:Beta-phosphoglucomutase n=1 Tax=Pontibacillus chungwhensis TaxID=265426 RepID=A0ABY8V487_9BACI|nr:MULTISPECIES: beta-phosphoglucomutase [Pontibacillus]MCD5322372.1 beta-phosphoglucomutase [Pontibacillus sp. HN14]WIF99659.1 beta-phosphoglucomutase [Pontibacillus chungwhensis]